ncbi:MAG: NUDIX hydrolase [Chloroflexota bacterium]
MPAFKRKVVDYITLGDCLLVFRHPDAPEAGIQVPAGTVEEGEDSHAAVLREATEETGLTGLKIASFLGEQRRDMADYGRDEIQLRSLYHVRCSTDPPASWRRYELHPSDGNNRPIEFDLFWVQAPNEIPDLVGDQGAKLPQLLIELERGNNVG